MKSFLILLFSVCFFFGHAQKDKSTQKPAPTQPQQQVQAPTQQQPQVSGITQHYLRKYSLAAQWNDFEVAKDALYDLIIENPANDSLLITLAYYYYENRQYASTLLISQELISRNPKDMNTLEMAAVSAEGLGVRDKALQYYETLYLQGNNVGTLYKVAFLQYDLKRFKESSANADILLSKPDIATQKVYFNDAENKPKEFIMKVAVLNLKGMLLQEEGDKVGAKKQFEQALALGPDFIPAKENLAKLK